MYVDSSVIMGMTGGHNGTGFDNIQYMVCRPENNFFPDLSKVGLYAGCRLSWGVGMLACTVRLMCPRGSFFPGLSKVAERAVR